MASGSQLDPTRTTLLRRDALRIVRRRFNLLQASITAALAAGALGGGAQVLLEAAAIEAFTEWLRAESERAILEPEWSWLTPVITAAVLRGVGHSDRALRRAGYKLLPSASGGVSLYQATIDRLALDGASLLRNATEDMITAVRGELVSGLGQWTNAEDLAARIAGQVEGVGVNRARVIVRTEIIRAHAEGTLDRLESYGIGQVEGQVEWDDGGHCPICTVLQQRDNGYGPGVYTLAQARGLIPVHPNCGCAWLPVLKPLLPVQNLQGGPLVAMVVAALRQKSRVLEWLLR